MSPSPGKGRGSTQRKKASGKSAPRSSSSGGAYGGDPREAEATEIKAQGVAPPRSASQPQDGPGGAGAPASPLGAYGFGGAGAPGTQEEASVTTSASAPPVPLGMPTTPGDPDSAASFASEVKARTSDLESGSPDSQQMFRVAVDHVSLTRTWGAVKNEEEPPAIGPQAQQEQSERRERGLSELEDARSRTQQLLDDHDARRGAGTSEALLEMARRESSDTRRGEIQEMTSEYRERRGSDTALPYVNPPGESGAELVSGEERRLDEDRSASVYLFRAEEGFYVSGSEDAMDEPPAGVSGADYRASEARGPFASVEEAEEAAEQTAYREADTDDDHDEASDVFEGVRSSTSLYRSRLHGRLQDALGY